MILDSIENAKLYRGLSPLIDRAIGFLVDTDMSEMSEQQIDIDGDDLYVMIQHYDTESAEGRGYETHNTYIDLQYVISGIETLLYSPRRLLTVENEYDAEKDYALYAYRSSDSPLILNLQTSDFVIFYPTDGHIPKVATGNIPHGVKKAVFKIRAETTR